MGGIWEFPNLPELEDAITEALEISRLRFQNQDPEQVGEEVIQVAQRVRARELIVFNSWGDGTAQIGSSTLKIEVFFEFLGDVSAIQGDLLIQDPNFSTAVEGITAGAEELIFGNEVDLPERFGEFFFDLELRPNGLDNLDNQVNKLLGNSERNTVFDLSELEAIQFTEPPEPDQGQVGVRGPAGVSDFEELARESLDELRERRELDVEDVDFDTGGVVQEPEEPEDVEPDEVEPQFEEIEEPLRQFAVSEDELKIPTGSEDKSIDAREPYDFEREMAIPTVDDVGIDDAFQEIGESIAGADFGEIDPPGTFPRTGIYIRNRLKYEGIAYIYELYKDLVYYSGYITGIHKNRVKTGFTTGKYVSFREFIWVLKEISEQDEGPILIEYLSQQAVAARGLSTTPDHPTIEGEDAPWLENRQYIDIENEDSEAWFDPYGFLHDDEDEEE